MYSLMCPVTEKRTDEEQRHKKNMVRMRWRKQQKAREHEGVKAESEGLKEGEAQGFRRSRCRLQEVQRILLNTQCYWLIHG